MILTIPFVMKIMPMAIQITDQYTLGALGYLLGFSLRSRFLISVSDFANFLYFGLVIVSESPYRLLFSFSTDRGLDGYAFSLESPPLLPSNFVASAPPIADFTSKPSDFERPSNNCVVWSITPAAIFPD